MWTRRAVSDMGLRSFSPVWSHKDTQLFWVSFEKKKKKKGSSVKPGSFGSVSLLWKRTIYMDKH